MIVDDNSSILGALRLLLERHFAKVTTLTSPKLLDTALRGEAVDAEIGRDPVLPMQAQIPVIGADGGVSSVSFLISLMVSVTV